MRWAITVISPDGYPHSEAFREVAESLHYGLLELGHDSVLTKETQLEQRRHIVLGSHLLGPHQRLPDDSILFNLEQITPGSPWLSPALLERFRRHEVWDYSRRNIEQLEALGIRRVKHVPIGYVPQLERIPMMEEDLDVLLVGSVNPRRMSVLEALAARGLRVHVGFGCTARRATHWWPGPGSSSTCITTRRRCSRSSASRTCSRTDASSSPRRAPTPRKRRASAPASLRFVSAC
jgi:hypothetical protein